MSRDARPTTTPKRCGGGVFAGEPTVLDHTGHPANVSWNAPLEMGFASIDPLGVLDLEREYPLRWAGTTDDRTFLARFSVGRQPPDPAWATGRDWGAVAD